MHSTDRPLIAFIHVPRSGGTTLRVILSTQLRTVFADSLEDAQSLVAALDEAGLRQVELIAGHIPYGVHEFVPRPVKYVTMLREPVARIVSHYWFVRNNSEHYLHRAVTDRDLSLRDYVESSSPLFAEIVNGQVGMFSPRARRLRRVDRQALDEAKSVLRDQFAAVGTTERFDESVVVIRRALSLRQPVYVRQNLGMMPREPIDAATRKAIEDRNLFDMELYEYANDLLDEQIRGVGPSFQRELSHFRRLNFAYGALHRFVPRLGRVIFDRSVPPGA